MAAKTQQKIAAAALDQRTARQLERVAKATNLKTSDLVRAGLRRVIDEHGRTGRVRVGVIADETEPAISNLAE